MDEPRKLLVPLVLVALAGLGGWVIWSGSDTDPTPTGVAVVGGPQDRDADVRSAALADASTESRREEIVAAVAEARADAIRVRGRVLDESGRAIAGISVEFRDHDAGNRVPWAFMVGGPGDRAAATASAATGEDGRFELAIAAGQAGRLTPAVDSGHLFHVEQKRFVSIPGYQGDRDLGDLTVVPAAALAGVVQDASGSPVEGAVLRLTSRGNGIRWGGHEATTDAGGRFRYPGLEAGDHRLSVAASGFVPQQRDVTLALGETQSGIDFQLAIGGAIAGRVVDDLGAPVVGAQVATPRQREAGFGQSWSQVDPREAVETDADGRFRLAGIATPTAELQIWADRHERRTLPDIATGSTDVLVTLARRASISGTLVDESGRPLEGSTVFLTDAAQDSRRQQDYRRLRMQVEEFELSGDSLASPRGTATTDADGRFELTDVAAGAWVLVARGSAHREVRSNPIQIRVGQSVDDVGLIAEVGAVLEVLALDAEGRPVADAEVVVRTQADRPRGGGGGIDRYLSLDVAVDFGSPVVSYGTPSRTIARATTDAEGRATIAGLTEGTFDVDAEHETFVLRAPVTATAHEASPTAVQLSMVPGGFFALQVVDDAGDPVAEARYEVRGPLGGDAEARTKRGATDGEGVASVGPLDPGNYAVSLLPPARSGSVGANMFVFFGDGGQNGAIPGTRVEARVAAGQSKDVRLVRPVLTVLHGTLAAVDGPVVGGRVQLRPKQDGDGAGFARMGPSATTDHVGRYRFDGVLAGDYVLEFRREDGIVPHRMELTVPVGVLEFAVDLPIRGGVLRLRVTDADGAPVIGARVRIAAEGAPAGGAAEGQFFGAIALSAPAGNGPSMIAYGPGGPEARTGPDGVAEIRDVPADRYGVKITHQGFADHELGSVDVGEDRETDLGTVRLPTPGEVEVQITGAPADARVLVELKPIEPEGEARRQRTRGGATVFRRVPAGRYSLRARAGGGGSFGPVEEITVGPGSSDLVRLSLPR